VGRERGVALACTFEDLQRFLEVTSRCAQREIALFHERFSSGRTALPGAIVGQDSLPLFHSQRGVDAITMQA
jgi:hypothetical protein